MKPTAQESFILVGDHTNLAHRIAPVIHLIQQNLVWIIIVLGLLIRLPLVGKPLTYSGSDTWRQADTASIAHNFINGHQILYPQIDWGGSGPGYVEAEFQLYPYIVSWLYVLFGEHVWLGRFVSLVFAALTYTVFYRLSRRFLSRMASLLALIFFMISPLAIRYSVAFMPEASVLFFYVAALYCFHRWLDDQRFSSLMLTAASTALAILVKPTSINIGLIFLIMLLLNFSIRDLIKRWELWLFAAVSLLPGTLYYLHARDLYLTYGNTFGIISGGDSKFGNLNYWFSPSFYLNLFKLDFHWVFAAAGLPVFIIGFVVSLRRKGKLLLVAVGGVVIFIYYLIVARYSSQEWGIQYHVYLLPFAALASGLGLEWLYRKAAENKATLTRALTSPYALAASALIVLMLVRSTASYRQDLLVPTEQDVVSCARDVAMNVPEGKLIIASSTQPTVDRGSANNYQEPYIFFYSHRNGWSLAADQHTPDKVEAFRQSGASYFVIYSQALYDANPDLAAYLQANADQIGPGVQAGCGIYQFKTS